MILLGFESGPRALQQAWRPALLLTVIAVLHGCAVTDAQQASIDPDIDSDGFENNLDDCPDTAAETMVNRFDCNLFAGVLEDVRFVTDGSVLDESAKQILNELASGLQSRPGAIVGVHAHTDNRGKATHNLELSKRRAMSVVEYLVKTGVSARQLKPFGYGESRPIVSNATPEGRLRNRRIEIVLLQ